MKRASIYSARIWGDDFQGVVFNNKFKSTDTSKQQVFTPGKTDIELVENCLRRGLDTLVSTPTYNFSGKSMVDSIAGKTVFPNLTYYVRQYFGYVNEKGEKIILVNSFYQYSHIYADRKYWLKQMVNVYDGGKAFWHVKVNLHTEQLFDLYINGI
ncbi:hypothetical protein [uncultured Mucilaginibacter sp.]|uniref:hypothetical protein n=1 Tax=uncultured Mucilaginibacter sp. TaxID=797541 RepID=UPI00260048A5|nr:hypothetical protein [uncultured Mucilaginibacter sp.]